MKDYYDIITMELCRLNKNFSLDVDIELFNKIVQEKIIVSSTSPNAF